jgi:porin
MMRCLLRPFFWKEGKESDAMRKTRMMIAARLAMMLVPISGFGQEERAAVDRTNALEGWLEERGISLESFYMAEFWANVRGGLAKEQTHLHHIALAAGLDTKRAGLWDGGKFFVHVLSDQGGVLLTEEIVGDSHTVSNIEAPHSTRLYELWYEHLLLDGRLSFLLGIHNLNSEFAVTEHGSLFINSSFGISKDISGGARPSIFPLAAPAIRTKFAPNKSWEFMLGVYNGDPGDPSVYRHFPRFVFDSQGGAFMSCEASYHFGHEISPGAVKVGYWKNTGRFEDVLNVEHAGNPVSHRGNEGFYLVADKRIFGTDYSRGLGAFVQLGSAPDRSINEFKSYVGGGLRFMGLIPHRRKDEAGIAVARALLNDRLAASPGRDSAETTLEITYRAVISKRLVLQPDVQFVFNPGADSHLRNAFAAGIRMEMTF